MTDDTVQKGRFKLAVGKPIEIEAAGIAVGKSDIPPKYAAIYDKVGMTMKAYLNSAARLSRDHFQSSSELLPAHLTKPGNTYILCCEDGIVIRHEAPIEGPRGIAVAYTEGAIKDMLPPFSDYLVYAQPQTDFANGAPVHAPTVSLGIQSHEGAGPPIANWKIAVFIPPAPWNIERTSGRPRALASIENSLEVELHGRLVEGDGTSDRPFIARSPIRLPLGWESLEVYSLSDVQNWNPDQAAEWAERDLLAAIVARQNRERFFQELDPHAAARLELGALLREFEGLLATADVREEALQQFLRQHPVLLSPTKTKIWPKLAFGRTESDFVVREATGEYLLIEIERPSLRLLRQDGQPTEQLTHAVNQVVDWKRYIEDNLDTVRRELRLDGITSNPRALVVIGRSNSLSDEDRRKIAAMHLQMPRITVLTYDEVLAQARALIENLLGPLIDQPSPTRIYFPPQK